MTKLLFKVPALALALGTAALATPATAQTVIASQSFETGIGTPGVQYGPDQFAAHNQGAGAVGPVVIPDFAFNGYSGVISNGTFGVFNNAPDGVQAAFLQAYTEPNGSLGGSSIVWTVPGLIVGRNYQLTFSSAGSLIVSTAPVTVSGSGLTTSIYNPGTAYVTNSLGFTATGNTITFSTPAGPGNVATALDALAITAVPEPATWAMMLLGFGMVGFGLRRRGAARPVALTA